MYLGFSQIPLAIGWTLEGFLGPWLYEVFASKDKFSRELLLQRLQDGQATLPTGSQLQEIADHSMLELSTIQDVGAQGAQALVDTIPQGEAFTWLVAITGQSPKALTDVLYQSHNVMMVWYIMGGVGIVTALGIYLYGRWVLRSPTSKTG